MYRALVPALLGAAVLSACSHETKTAAAPDIAPYVSTREADRIEYAVPNHLLFATDSSEVLPTGHKILEAIAGAAKRRGAAPIEVAGYADTVGRKTYNQKLSEERAQAVASELAGNGVEAARITTRGYGESELAVATPNNTDEAKNRRVVVRIASI
jgi:outer membrane protein OmpA-like peptidoglycan-associated protein